MKKIWILFQNKWTGENVCFNVEYNRIKLTSYDILAIPCPDAQAELYSELLATKVTLREQEEKIKAYEKENARWAAERSDLVR